MCWCWPIVLQRIQCLKFLQSIPNRCTCWFNNSWKKTHNGAPHPSNFLRIPMWGCTWCPSLSSKTQSMKNPSNKNIRKNMTTSLCLNSKNSTTTNFWKIKSSIRRAKTSKILPTKINHISSSKHSFPPTEELTTWGKNASEKWVKIFSKKCMIWWEI